VKRKESGKIMLVVLMAVLAGLSFSQDTERRDDVVDLAPLQTPQGFFPVLPWDPLRGWKHEMAPGDELKRIKDCHFTMGGFVKPEDLSSCEALGLKALMFGTKERGPLSRKEWNSFSEEEIRAFVKTMVEDAGQSEAILGYFLVDEPGATLFPKLSVAVEAVKRLAPGKLAYINLFPGYATIGAPDTSQLQTKSFAEYLERFVREVRPQILSYDNYMVQYSQDLKEEGRAKRYYLDLLEVRRVALKYGLPFWNIVSSNQIRPHTTIPSPANMQFQAFTTLAAGGRGVTWYTYNARGYGYAPVAKGGNITDTWVYLQMVNGQLQRVGPYMNGLKSTGVFFSDPPPVPEMPLIPGDYVEGVNAPVPVMIGEFVDAEDTPHVMAVNLSLEHSAKVLLDLTRQVQDCQSLSSASGEWIDVEEGPATWLTAGQGILLRLR